MELLLLSAPCLISDQTALVSLLLLLLTSLLRAPPSSLCPPSLPSTLFRTSLTQPATSSLRRISLRLPLASSSTDLLRDLLSPQSWYKGARVSKDLSGSQELEASTN